MGRLLPLGHTIEMFWFSKDDFMDLLESKTVQEREGTRASLASELG